MNFKSCGFSVITIALKLVVYSVVVVPSDCGIIVSVAPPEVE